LSSKSKIGEDQVAIVLVRKDGTTVNSNLGVFEGAHWFEIVVDSAGGSGEGAINPDYAEAVDELLSRLGACDALLIAVVLNSRRVAQTALHNRILTIDEYPYPIYLRTVSDKSALRKSIANSGARTLSDSGKGGNPRRRLSLIFTLPGSEAIDVKVLVEMIGARAVV
jgi:hypothetical protein